MKMFFIKYLLFSVLMSGTIMSVHAYVHVLDCTTSEQQQFRGDMDNKSDLQKASCDHCCHFSSHSVGIIKSNSVDGLDNKSNMLTISSLTYRSLKEGPPYHPPILL